MKELIRLINKAKTSRELEAITQRVMNENLSKNDKMKVLDRLAFRTMELSAGVNGRRV